MTAFPPELRYIAEHQWIDSSTPPRVGITDTAQDALGEIVYLQLPSVGDAIVAGEVCGEVESTKSVSEIYAPASGTVVAVNEAVLADPAILNADPYGDGWLFTVAATAFGALLDAAGYEEVASAHA